MSHYDIYCSRNRERGVSCVMQLVVAWKFVIFKPCMIYIIHLYNVFLKIIVNIIITIHLYKTSKK